MIISEWKIAYICCMATLIVETQSNEELKLISALLKKMGVKSKKLSTSEKEELAETLWIKDADISKIVSEAEIMKKLKK